MSRVIGSPRANPAEPTTPPAVATPAVRGPAKPPAVEVPSPIDLSDAERDALLRVARAAVAVAVRAAPGSTLEDALRGLEVDRAAAAFVTLTEDGELRGCIGHMDGSAPVIESVIEAATWAARGDPRFPSVGAADLPRIHVEVSVLGPLVPLEDPVGFRLGIDGIVVERGGRRGLLLPEVALTHGMDQVAMLETTCRKAGLPAGAWRDRDTTVLAFRTARFGGPAVSDEP